MAQPAAFVPAWKRLGLKLTKFSAESGPNHDVAETQNNRSSTQHEGDLHEESTPGQTSQDHEKLGKRKHRPDEADVEVASVKKSKHHRASGPVAGDAAAVPEVAFEPNSLIASEATPAEGAQSKGDPNYRKKKGGDSNYRKKKEKKPKHGRNGQMQSNQSLAPPKAVRTPSLSPGRTEFMPNDSTLLPSTETNLAAPAALATPQRQRTAHSSNLSLSPPKTDRRKSVTFTPDTKTSDGHSAHNYFKQWVAEQKGSSADYTPAEVAQTTQTTTAPRARLLPLKVLVAGQSKKKDTSRSLNYLAQYYQDRSNWKFNKAIQNDLLDNALNIFRVPDEYLDALLEYVQGLQGAGVISRLRERCKKTIEEINGEISKESMEEREALKEEALQERISKERKRRQTDEDVENMVDHPFPEGYVRRLKRSRAEALCRVLDIAMPPIETPRNEIRTSQSSTSALAGTQGKPRSRKSRTDISSDESSDSSSSEESSSEESSDESSSSSDDDNGSDGSDTEPAAKSSDESGESSDSSDSGDDSD